MTPTPPDSPEVLLEVRDLCISARLGSVERVLTSHLHLTVHRGEAVAVVGESGSGKSLTARAMVGLLPRGVTATGEVLYRGEPVLGIPERRLRGYRGAEMTLLPQDPYTLLNPVKRCGEQVLEGLRANGQRLRGPAAEEEARRRLDEVGIGQLWVVNAYPYELSGGMQQRVGIAAALARDPQILVADEPSTALDVTTQRQMLDLLGRLREDRGMALVLITHDLRVAFSSCNHVYVLYAGSILEAGPAKALAADPLHPYTAGLMLAEPPLDRTVARLSAIPGQVPEPKDVLGKCRFSARCQWCAPRCVEAEPALVTIGELRQSRCLRSEEISSEMRDELAAGLLSTLEPPANVDGASLLEVEGLRVVFRGRRGREPVVAVDGVDVVVQEGESVGIVGESGSGKTTVARSVVGLTAHQGGEVRVGGLTLPTGRLPGTKERQRLARVAQVVFQDPYSSLNPAMTIGGALAESAGRAGPVPSYSVAELLDLVGLPTSYAERKPVALSGGERQRVAIARALSVRPRLLVCDEPVSALDVSVQAQILTLLRDLRRELGLSYLFITHDLSVVRQVTDRVYVMHRGRVAESGRIDVVLDSPVHEYTRSLIESVPGQ